MLFGFKLQVFERAGRLVRAQGSADAVGAGELRHDKAAAAQVADKAPENGIGHAGHRCQHGGWTDDYVTDF